MMSKKFTVGAEPWEWPILGATDPSAVALIVIDMQRDFLDPRGWFASMGFDVTAMRTTIDVVAGLVAVARSGSGIHVIHTRQGNAGDLSDLPQAKQEQGNASAALFKLTDCFRPWLCSSTSSTGAGTICFGGALEESV